MRLDAGARMSEGITKLMKYPKFYWVVRTYDSERYAAKVPVRIGLFGIDHWYHRAKESGNCFRTKAECERWIDRIGHLVTSN